VQSPHLTPIERVTVGDEIVRRLTNYILDHGLKPGDKLPTERELMTLLSVGRSSLREAIKTLSAVGLVRVAVREGMFVGGGESSVLSKPLSWALLLGERSTREVVEARRAVEIELAGLAAQRATPAAIATISRVYEQMRASRGDGVAYTQADLEFHLAVARAADSQVLYHILETLRHIIHAWIEKTVTGNRGRPRSLDEHAPILDAIRRHDRDLARAAMASHLDAAAARLLALVAPTDEEDRRNPDGRVLAAT
jgi:GntR family transcriptional repressor for pyruvate dehydrogenase complex